MPVRTLAALTAALLFVSCGGSADCTLVGGESAVTLTIPSNGQIVQFCVDGFECVEQLAEPEATVFLRDDEVMAYEYSVIVQLDGDQIDFAGMVELEPLFPNGEDCGRSGKFAELVVIDADTIETQHR